MVATDASEHGYGVCLSESCVKVFGGIGRVSERSRFRKRPYITGARESFYGKYGLNFNSAGELKDTLYGGG